MRWSDWRPVGARSTTWWRPTEGLLVWAESAWDDYLWWQAQDRKLLRRITILLADIKRSGNVGIGKPERPKHDFADYWTRRITDQHRLVYKIAGDQVRIAACRYHYA